VTAVRPSTLLLLASVAVSAAFALVAARRDDRQGYYLFKPLTTLIILFGALWLIQPAPPLYRALVVIGLGCSLGGDILLMLPRERLTAGIVAFLFAQLAYVAAFSLGNPFSPAHLVWLLPFAAVGGAVLWDRWGAFGRFRFPVVIYAAVLVAMVWRAAMRGKSPVIPRQTFLFGVTGASLFLVSDAVLVLRRFGRVVPGARSLELSLYWAAQFLIAMSVRGTIA
jgi:uncharacterized membrane protein YhhN